MGDADEVSDTEVDKRGWALTSQKGLFKRLLGQKMAVQKAVWTKNGYDVKKYCSKRVSKKKFMNLGE